MANLVCNRCRRDIGADVLLNKSDLRTLMRLGLCFDCVLVEHGLLSIRVAAFEKTADTLGEQIRKKDWAFEQAVQSMKKKNQRIAELEKELDKHRWIPVEEKLPEDGGLYLLTKDEGEDLWLDIFGPAPKGFKCIKDYIDLHKITHWQSIVLPEQPLHLSQPEKKVIEKGEG